MKLYIVPVHKFQERAKNLIVSIFPLQIAIHSNLFSTSKVKFVLQPLGDNLHDLDVAFCMDVLQVSSPCMHTQLSHFFHNNLHFVFQNIF